MEENPKDLDARVNRERLAHTEKDVLAHSIKLKNRFKHVLTSPTRKRLDKDFNINLSNVNDLRVMDLGCGYGHRSVELIKNGANVLGIDISESYIENAKCLAANHQPKGGKYEFRVMDAHKLEVEDGSFDLIVGEGVLHHLELASAIKEIHRALRVGGRALFIEPLGANPLLKLFRALTPKARTVDEKPLMASDLNMLEENWKIESKYYGIISAPIAMLTSVVLPSSEKNWLLRTADKLELKINKVKAATPYNQYVMLNLVKEFS